MLQCPVEQTESQTAASLRSVWLQEWLDVLFLHWPVPAPALRPHVPAALEIDVSRDTAWVSLVLFRLRVRPPWLPFLPGLSSLVEVNLRTYIHDKARPGIWFLSVDADNRWAIRLGRLLTPMPYRRADLRYQRIGERFEFEAAHDGLGSARSAWSFIAAGEPMESGHDSLDEWLLERYRLFAPGRGARLVQADVEHSRWATQPVELSLARNGFGRCCGLDLSHIPALAHFSPGVAARFGPFRQCAELI